VAWIPKLHFTETVLAKVEENVDTVPFRESVAKCLTAQVRETVMTYSDDHASECFAKHTSQLSNSKQLLRLFREHSSELPIRNYPQIRLCTNSQDEAHDEQHAFTTLLPRALIHPTPTVVEL
jgi:hypothetical protein